LDCGCEVFFHRRNKFLEFFEKVKTDLLIGGLTRSENNEKKWNKMDVIEKIGVKEDILLDAPQRQAGVQILYICDKTRQLINEWYELTTEYHNIDDSPSLLPNFPDFREHRHDQSVFSLLTKKYGIFSHETIKDCVEIKRNKTGVSVL
jgi:hypothetical protein